MAGRLDRYGREMRRRGRLALAGALVAVSCGGAPWSSGGEPEVEVVEGLDGPSAPLVAAGDVLLAAPPASEEGVDGTAGALLRSDDRGRTWEPLGLPGAPEHLDLSLEHVPGPDVVVAVGREVVESLGMQVPGGASYVWTSRDGREWRGGPLAADPPPFADVAVESVGDLLVAGVPVGGDLVHAPSRYVLHRSDDGGATWTPAAVEADLTIAPGGRMELLDVWEDGDRLVAHLGLGRLSPGDAAVEPSGGGGPPSTARAPSASPSTTEPPPAPAGGVQAVLVSDDGGSTWRLAPCPAEATDAGGGCARPEAYGDLQVRGDEVSADGGRTWERPTVDGEPVDDEFSLGTVLELDGGGWLATARTDDGDTVEGHLLRSDDGRAWEDLLPDAGCDASLGYAPFVGPVPFGDGWLVAHGCSDLGDPVSSEAYTIATDGRDVDAVPGTRRTDAVYEDVAVVGDTAVVLADRTEGRADLVLVTP